LQPITSSLESGGQRGLVREIQALLLEKLSIGVESPETDLLETGILDSAAQVQLLLHLEKHFGLRLPMENLEIDSFLSVASIAELVANYSRSQADRSEADWQAQIEPRIESSQDVNGALTYLCDSEVDEAPNLIREIQVLFEEKLSIQVETETNLFETGVLDSITLVQCILHLEERFAFQLPMEDIEADSFSTVTKIAELVASRTCNYGKQAVNALH
jgi:acyl carrier protein